MELQKEPSDRRDHRRACRNYGYGHCYSRSGWMGNGMHLTVGCDGDCRRMKIYDNKHGLKGPFKIDY